MNNPEVKMEEDTRRDLCLDTLIGGNLRSFEDLFDTLHSYHDETGELQSPEFTNDEQLFIKENLETSEMFLREGDLAKTHQSYRTLAQFLVDKQQRDQALKFFEKALNIVSEQSEYRNLQMISQCDLGEIHQSFDDKTHIQRSIEHFSEYVRLAKELDLREPVKKSHEKLVNILRISAQYLNESDPYKTISILEGCIDKAKEYGDLKGLTSILIDIGHVYQTLEELDKANNAFKDLLKVSLEIDDKYSECVSYLELGRTYSMSEDRHLSEKYLELSLKLSMENGFDDLEKESSKSAGQLFSKLGQHSLAYQRFLDNYLKSKAEEDRDQAKIRAGVEKALSKMDEFETGLKNNDVLSLIQLKSKQ